jgi:hypothetical protein
MRPVKIFFISILCLATVLMGQSDPVDISTAGASQLRLKGQLTLSRNPASLGYFALTKPLEPSKNDSVSLENLDEPDSLETPLMTTLPDDIFLDEFLDEVSDLIDEPNDTSLPDSVPTHLESKVSHFSMSLLNISTGYGNSSITPNWINNQLFGGKDLRDPIQKEEFFSGLSEDISLFISNSSSLPLLNFSFGPNVISIGQAISYTSVNIPSGLAQFPF